MTQEYIVRMPSDMPYEIKAELNAWYVESEPIVRCRDCAYYDDEHGLDGWGPKCWRDPNHSGTWVWTRPDGFCWRAERKGEE